jgi:hypothetical protein
VRRITFRAVSVGLAVTAAAAFALLTTSGSHALVLDVYLLCLGGVLLLALVRTTRLHAEPHGTSQFEHALATMRAPPPKPGESALVRDLELSTYNTFHFHARLRPLLRDIAAERLRSRYGVELDAEPGRARELVGTAAWEVVRPDRPPPEDRLAVGPTAAELRLLVDELEAI